MQKERLSVHLTLHITGAGEGTETRDQLRHRPAFVLLTIERDERLLIVLIVSYKMYFTDVLFMDILNRSGLRTEPCRTLVDTVRLFAGSWVSRLWSGAGLHGGGVCWQ